jgi:hypothetical protein
MTTTDPAADPVAVPTEDDAVTEHWTYGGTNAATGKDRRDLWYDGDRHRWYFTPVKGAHPAVGCVYTVQAARWTAADGKERIQRYTVPAYEGRQDDRDWAAALQAAAHAVDLEIAADQMERRAKRDPEIERALAPILRVAANMNYATRSALVDLVTREIYRADRKRTGPAPAGGDD